MIAIPTFSEQEKKKSRNCAIIICVLSLLISIIFLDNEENF